MNLSPGTRLGAYETTEPIGAGGMGEVYRAKDTRLDRTVAVKVLPVPLAADRERRERFEREARAISSLSHPHSCALYDVGHQDGVDFPVMEYLEGETLADRLKKGPLPLGPLLRHGIEIADALDKAHRKGIVHRDLKPANVMLTKSGTKLLDFGFAKPTGDGVLWPSFLPDGRSLLYLVQSALPERAGIHVLSLDSKETKRLLPAQTNAVYAPPGYLFFGRDRALVAQPFDPRAHRLTGDSYVVAEEDLMTRRVDVAASTSGILAYRSESALGSDLVWFDRTGKRLGAVSVPSQRYGFSLSRDDERLAVLRAPSPKGEFDLWLSDLARHTDLRFTFDPARESVAVRSPDGGRIVFASDREGHFDL